MCKDSLHIIRFFTYFEDVIGLINIRLKGSRCHLKEIELDVEDV
jgi:hypothetical protein